MAGGGEERRPGASSSGGSLRSTPGTPCSRVRFWNGLLEWIKGTLVKKKTLSESSLEVFNVVDTPEEAMGIIKRRVIV